MNDRQNIVVVVFGLPGSGKSFFASRLATRLEANYINSDIIRHQILSVKTYSKKEKGNVYQAMLSEMEASIERRESIVLDATFYKTELRNSFKETAGALGSSIKFIEVNADEELIRERVSRKREYSEADFSVYQKVKDEFEPMKEEHLNLQSGRDNVDSMLDRTIEYLDQCYE